MSWLFVFALNQKTEWGRKCYNWIYHVSWFKRSMRWCVYKMKLLRLDRKRKEARYWYGWQDTEWKWTQFWRIRPRLLYCAIAAKTEFNEVFKNKESRKRFTMPIISLYATITKFHVIVHMLPLMVLVDNFMGQVVDWIKRFVKGNKRYQFHRYELLSVW